MLLSFGIFSLYSSENVFGDTNSYKEDNKLLSNLNEMNSSKIKIVSNGSDVLDIVNSSQTSNTLSTQLVIQKIKVQKIIRYI